MSACTFFGHRNAPESVKPLIESTITKLITKHNVTTFFVGNHGSFDRLVYITLKELEKLYPQIKYYVVLAYLPTKKTKYEYINYADTIFPDCLTAIPPRFAISKRNIYMIKNSDYVITYVNNNFGCAAQFAEKAKRKNKIVINLI